MERASALVAAAELGLLAFASTGDCAVVVAVETEGRAPENEERFPSRARVGVDVSCRKMANQGKLQPRPSARKDNVLAR